MKELIWVEPNSERWLSLEDLPNEEWRDIKDFEGLYQVSNYGRIKSLERFRKLYTKKIYVPEIIRKNGFDKNGYQIIPLNKNSKKYMKKIHRIVAETFISNENDKPCVDHVNCVVSDNRITNLRWVTVKENTDHCIKLCHQFNINKYMQEKRAGVH